MAAWLRVTMGEDFGEAVLPGLRRVSGERAAEDADAPAAALRREDEGDALGEALEVVRGELARADAVRLVFGDDAAFLDAEAAVLVGEGGI